MHIMDTGVLRCCDLLVGYHGHGGVKPVAGKLNITLERGKLTCLTGANGSGKTTLMRTLDGWLQPLAGKVMLDNRPLEEVPKKELARRIGVVLTEHTAVEGLSVFDVVSTGRMPYCGFWGILGDKDKRIVARALEQVGMESFCRRKFCDLSDGERQKVMIAKVLAQQTDIMLLDEPLSFLDEESRMAMMTLLQEVAHKEGAAVLVSIHDLELAQGFADCIWEIRCHGKDAPGEIVPLKPSLCKKI